MAIVWIILAGLLSINSAAGQCSSGRFGPACAYYCHCSQDSRCNDASGCQGACDSRWRGSTCQQGNIAFGRPTKSSNVHSTNQGSEKAVDGHNSHQLFEFHTWYNENPPPKPTFAWWSVDLGFQKLIQEVIIYFRTDFRYRRNGLRFYTLTTQPNLTDSSTWGQPCYTVTGLINGSNILDNLNIPACRSTLRYLFIYTDTANDYTGPVLDFKEVEIYACSTGTYGTDCSQFCDGCDSDGCHANGQCVTGCSTFRYGTNCSMFCNGCNSDGCHSNGTCKTGCVTGRYGADCSSICDGCNNVRCDSNGQCISDCKDGRIPFPSCNQNCPEGYYGTNCIKLCSQRGCRQPDNSCDPENGRCVNLCRSNFLGTDCGACADGWYGDNCDKQCSSRQCAFPQISTYCTRYRGDCNPAGCLPGWRNNDCITPCAQNTYGLNCSKLCSDRKCLDPLTSCNPGTGECVDGCTAGYTGTDCGPCASGTYGPDCNSTCGNCTGDVICDHVTGNCPGDCKPGWRGSQCKQACQEDYYGANYAELCSQRGCRQPNKSCDNEIGRCLHFCRDNFIGADCRDCVNGWYGDTCENQCDSRQCVTYPQTSPCDRYRGDCNPTGCRPGWQGSDSSDREHYGSDCARTCTDIHCNTGSSCSPSTGVCEGGCQTGWAGNDCMESSAVKSPSAVDQTPVVVGTVAAVIVIILSVVVAVVIWRRKKRRSESEAKSDLVYYNTTTPEVSEPESEVRQSPPVGHYDSIDAVSRDDGATYTTIGPLDQGEGVCVPRPVSDVTVRDEYEPVSGKTYEKLTSTSRDNDGDYTGLGRRNSYENVR